VLREDFTSQAWGSLVSTTEGNPAFVPRAAPRALTLTPEVISLLDRASHHLGVLAGIGKRLPNPQLLIGPYLRREAVLSSRIEGTQTTLSDVYAAEAEQLRLITSPDVQEVVNYIDTAQYGLERLATLPLSLRFLKELHERLMAHGVRGHGSAGEFRTYQNFIGGTTEGNATYVPPPVLRMNDCLDDFETYLHDRSLPPLIQAAVLHYQFEAIHPFGDGNGRVGRLLMTVFLAERELLPQPLLYLSAYFERERAAYYGGLMRISTHGDWDAWFRYVLAGVRDQARAAADLADRLLELQSETRERLRQRRATANAVALVDALFMNPLITVRRAQALLHVSHPTARATIRALEQAGVVREITGRARDMVFSADEIYALIRVDGE
jgi:Fic family protein